MAAIPPLLTATQLANNIPLEEIPVKLRCATCNRLAINAVGLPCCDQNICETCQNALKASCPLCEHSPLDLESAKVRKVIRNTVSAFIKNLEKKQEKARASAAAEKMLSAGPPPANHPSPSIPAQPVVESTSTSIQAQNGVVNGEDVEVEGAASHELREVQSLEIAVAGESYTNGPESAEQEADEVDSTEVDADEDPTSRSRAQTEETDIDIVTGDEPVFDADGNIVKQASRDEDEYEEHWQQGVQGQGHHYGGDGSYNGTQAAFQAGFPGMDWSNPSPEMQHLIQMQMQMQQLQQMQNAGWNGNPNMMMPGMGMNPMDMSAMVTGMGAQGMGGMNPNMANMMGMNGMNAMMGMDFAGGYDMWNHGQQMVGGFGASSGFYPGAGLNQAQQGQFPQMSHQQQYPKNNFHNQNRGFQGSQRGYGRGHHNQGNGHIHNQAQMQFSGPPPGAPKGPKAAQGFQGNHDAFHHQLPPKVQSRRPSQVMSAERRQQLEFDAKNQINRFEDVPDVDTTLNTATDGPTQSEKDTDVPSNTNGELSRQEFEVDTAAGALAGAPTQDIETTTDQNEQSQLGHHGDPSDEPAYAASTNGLAEDSNGGIGEQGIDTSYEAQSTHSVQDSDLPLQAAVPANHYAAQNRGGFRGRGDVRGGFRGRGGPTRQYHGSNGPAQVQGNGFTLNPSEPAGTGVQGAPKGPKAMREGLPSNGWSARGRATSTTMARGGAIIAASPAASASVTEATFRQEKAPSERARSRSKSRSRSRSPSHRHRSRRYRSRTPSSESERDKKRESRRRRSSRKYENDEVENGDRDREEHDEEKDRSRDKDRHRSSRSHRESSRHRRRRRTRSRSPVKADDIDAVSLANRESKDADKKYRDRERDDRDKDRRERDKKKRSRRSESRESDGHHRSSRHGKKDKERDRDRDRGHDAATSARVSQPQTPLQPEVAEFKIQGRSKDRYRNVPPTGPAAMQPPTGPRTQTQAKAPGKLNTEYARPIATPKGHTTSSRNRNGPSQPPTPTSAAQSLPPTPTSTTLVDPYQQEREKRTREREMKEAQRRATMHGPTTATTSLSRKRSIEDVTSSTPTGPKAGKKVRASEGRGGKSRRVNYKYEDEVDGDRGERERESARY